MSKLKKLTALVLGGAVLVAAALTLTPPEVLAESFEITSGKTKLAATAITAFDEPWAMTFLPDGTLLVTTKPGKLFHVTVDGKQTEVSGIWQVAYGGQGGLGDVVLHPDFKSNSLLYISSAETLDQGATYGAIVTRARLDLSGDQPKLTDQKKIWTQAPKTSGQGHYSHRIAFGPDGHLFITSGDKQLQKPAQDMKQGLGKVIRLNVDGTLPADNPFQNEGELAKSFWSIGHRNLLGIAFDREGRLWTHEMGPRHGDELNLVEKGQNYGWPEVSYGDNYSLLPIPDHDTTDKYVEPKAYWVPAISPSGLIIYNGDYFKEWNGNAFIGGLSSEALVRVEIKGTAAKEAERFEWGQRVREVEQGPDGAIYVLEDGRRGSAGRLLKITKVDG